MITIEQFKTLFPSAKDPEEWVEKLNANLGDINTPRRIAAFLAQCGHESNGFTVLEENLNYSTEGLLKTFPKYFNQSSAELYARKKEAIANYVYKNRMGNGDEASGDGWKYRGRGLIQITGRENYTKFANDIVAVPQYFIDNPDIVSKDPLYAILTAVWYWERNSLNVFADRGDLVTITKRINGGLNGQIDRVARYDKTLEIMTG